jgi:2'-5' RNA ligase
MSTLIYSASRTPLSTPDGGPRTTPPPPPTAPPHPTRRPGWQPGSRFFTWYLTFHDAPQVHELASRYRTALANVPGLDLVPDKWLHLTMQGLGFVDDVSEKDARAMVEAATVRLATVQSFDLELGRPTITPEAIRWDPISPGPAAVRQAIRAAISDVWPHVPEAAEGFSAHVTIAYSSSNGPAHPVNDALITVPSSPVVARIAHADLIILNRDHRMYEWQTFATVPLSA